MKSYAHEFTGQAVRRAELISDEVSGDAVFNTSCAGHRHNIARDLH